MKAPLFSETQRFDQLWLRIPMYALGLFMMLLFARGMYTQFIIGEPWGDNPMSDNGLIVATLITMLTWIGIILLFEKSKLVTTIYMNELRLRFPPFFSKEKILPVSTIKSIKVRKYNPIWEYGGWGIRYGFRGKAYNVKGNIGIQIHFKDGKSLLIGTQKPEQVKWTIQKMLADN